MSSIIHKHAQRARLSTALDQLLRDYSIPSPRADLIRQRIEGLEAELTALDQEIKAMPLELKEVIELTSGEHHGQAFIVHALRPGNGIIEVVLQHLDNDGLRTLTDQELAAFGFRRSAKWSGKGCVPAIKSDVFVRMNGLGPATVVDHEIVEGWLGLRVRFHTPPAWWVKQNRGHRPLGLIFGAEIR